MAIRFFDTSAFAKHYRTEVGTATVDTLLAETGSRHIISDLGVVELHSVIARLVREGAITAAEFQSARGRFLADVVSNVWEVAPVTAAHFHLAQQLLLRHGLTSRLRTLDAIQRAVALVHIGAPLDAFVSADSNLCLIAAAEGLTVLNPEVP
ncbi:MAG TPA: type II toxin-antitoxin system VapC family toxin [Pirellulales bacterium]|nr:type II toxin-antitoxin system VapC family toxin [Pirellulales bacterium]